MAKSITKFVCQECGYDSPQWLGKCPECGAWNSLKEFHEAKVKASSGRNFASSSGLSSQSNTPKMLKEITLSETSRFTTGFGEMDTVLGGGIVPGSVILLAGDPGIGKSTLLLQLALNVASNSVISSEAESRNLSQQPKRKNPNESLKNEFGETDPSTPNASPSTVRYLASQKSLGMTNKKVLYISGEESVEQIKLRASRIEGALENENLLLVSLSNTDAAAEIIEQEKPSLVIIDSVQTMESEALDGLSGSVGQVRYAATRFIRTAKNFGIPVIIVGHVTKEGMVAGPMVLSHMVDTVMFLEGEKFTSTRLLRSLKNRFGPVDEVGVFAMESGGMIEIKNPEQLFLTKRDTPTPGSVLTVVMEGTRPFLIEIQALVVYSKLPMPRRVAAGIDHKRLELLLAVLQKHCQLNVDSMDVFVNVAGGLKVSDPAIDAAICLAVFGSLKNVSLSETVGIAEVGLLGEMRNVGGIDKRIREAEKLGFKQIISAKRYKNLREVLKNVIPA
jgi:DNA repair protein RadA/Sms